MLTDEQKDRMAIWYVLGDHPILKRPDKYGMFKNEALRYADELIKHGYENIEVRTKE